MSTDKATNPTPPQARIDWTYAGPTDPLCGTGATPSERLLAHGSATLLAVIIVALDRLRATPIAPGWRLPILAFLAYDIAGGAVAYMLNSCKRFYHTPPRPHEGTMARLAKNARLFTALHVQPVAAASLLGGDVRSAVAWYLALQVGVAAVLAAPLHLRRAVATAVTLLAVLANGVWAMSDGLEWFVPCLFIKMAIGHAVREEPYRPEE